MADIRISIHLSDTRPEQKEPSAKPVKSSILARVLSQLLHQWIFVDILDIEISTNLFSQTRSHSVTMVASQKSGSKA